MGAAHVTPAPLRPRFSSADRQVWADRALAEQAAHAGRMLEAALQGGDRELALIWQAAMYAIVGLRRSRRLGSDIHSEGESLVG